jgi:hypothetical protein
VDEAHLPAYLNEFAFRFNRRRSASRGMVIGRGQVTARAWDLGGLLDWALERAAGAGFASVAVARAGGAPVAGAGSSWPQAGAGAGVRAAAAGLPCPGG